DCVTNPVLVCVTNPVPDCVTNAVTLTVRVTNSYASLFGPVSGRVSGNVPSQKVSLNVNARGFTADEKAASGSLSVSGRLDDGELALNGKAKLSVKGQKAVTQEIEDFPLEPQISEDVDSSVLLLTTQKSGTDTRGSEKFVGEA